ACSKGAAARAEPAGIRAAPAARALVTANCRREREGLEFIGRWVVGRGWIIPSVMARYTWIGVLGQQKEGTQWVEREWGRRSKAAHPSTLRGASSVLRPARYRR